MFPTKVASRRMEIMSVPSQRNNPGLQDDHDPNDIAQRQNNGKREPAISSESNAFKGTPAGFSDRAAQKDDTKGRNQSRRN